MLALLKQLHFIFKQTFKYPTHELRTKFNKSACVRRYVQLVNRLFVENIVQSLL